MNEAETVRRLETIRFRECGDCRACCKVGYINEWGYAANGEQYQFYRRPNTWCRHACERGCAVWGEEPPIRPALCSRFRCAWLNGVGREEDRPDRIRAVVTFEIGPDRKPVWIIQELDTWTAERGRANRLFEELRRTKDEDILIVTPGKMNRHWSRYSLTPMIYERQCHAIRPGIAGPDPHLAWGDHDHTMIPLPGGGTRCQCGFVDMRER